MVHPDDLPRRPEMPGRAIDTSTDIIREIALLVVSSRTGPTVLA